MAGQVGPVVGIIGGGQLARMLVEAAYPLGISVKVLAAASDEGAEGVSRELTIGDPYDAEALESFARSVDVLTIDHENVDHDTLERLESQGFVVRPSVATLAFSDKAHQRRVFAGAGLPVPPFEVIAPEDPDALAVARSFAVECGGSVVAKASRGGYDGRGVWMLEAAELGSFLEKYRGAPLVLEPHLDLERELAVLVARRPSGETVTWPVLETVQVDGMCDEVIFPAEVAAGLAGRAEDLGARVADVTGAAGVLAIELFVVAGELLINEIAPRVHNSGHLSIEAMATSQFEQHLRAVLDWPLGPTRAVAPVAVMANVVGADGFDPRTRQASAYEAVPEAHVHLYGKLARPRRKIGHVTVLGDERDRTRQRAASAAAELAGTVADHDVR